MTTDSATHPATPWPDEESRLASWRKAVTEQRGGEAYGDLLAAHRLLQDRVAGCALPHDLVETVTAKITELNELLAPHQVPEPERWDGWRPDLPGRALPLLPPYLIDEVGDTTLRGRVTFTRFYLGGGAAAHGGSHGLLFDDVMGNVVGRQDGVSRTAFLKVNYRRITPLDVELTWDVSLEDSEGRKRWVTARLYNPAGEVVSDAEALFLRLLPGQQ